MKKVQLNPVGWMSQLSQIEVSQLQDTAHSQLFHLFKNCCLAVLNSGVDEDNFEALFAPYKDFNIKRLWGPGPSARSPVPEKSTTL